MTKPGQRTAIPPVSPRANLTAVERVGATKHGSAIWVMGCTCGRTFKSEAPRVKNGYLRCPDCNPTSGELDAKKILAVLPATRDEIVKRTGLTLETVRFRLSRMKPNLCHIGKYRRPPGSGAWQPVFCEGAGEDAACTFTRRTVAEGNRRYRQRVSKAIERALSGGKEDPRYAAHIGRRKADETVKKVRAIPQTWLSVLGVGL